MLLKLSERFAFIWLAVGDLSKVNSSHKLSLANEISWLFFTLFLLIPPLCFLFPDIPGEVDVSVSSLRTPPSEKEESGRIPKKENPCMSGTRVQLHYISLMTAH